MNKPPLTVILAQPRSFCAGVERAIKVVDRALELYGAPVYVKHEIVHNKYVLSEMRNRGVVFVEDLTEVPSGSVVIFSAHGVAEVVEMEAKNLQLHAIDATCPLVKKVHAEARAHDAAGKQIIMIGHAGHPEVEGTRGRVQQEIILVQSVKEVAALQVRCEEHLAYITQTTLSVDDTKQIINALKKKFPKIVGPELRDICYATQNRQRAVQQLAGMVDMMLVIGSQNSSNSQRLHMLSRAQGIPSFLIDGADEIPTSIFTDKPKRLGITAGASVPELLLQQVIDRLADIFLIKIEVQQGVQENIQFKLPIGLQ